MGAGMLGVSQAHGMAICDETLRKGGGDRGTGRDWASWEMERSMREEMLRDVCWIGKGV